MSKVMIQGQAEEMLKEASKELGFSNNADAVRYAIGLLKMAADAKDGGLGLAMIDKEDHIKHKISGLR